MLYKYLDNALYYKNIEKCVVTVFPDSGERYLSTEMFV